MYRIQIFLLSAITLLFSVVAHAEKGSLPKPYSFQFGQFKITALSDGVVSVPLSAYRGNKNYKQIEKRILQQHHIKLNDKKSVLVSLNAYLVQVDGKNILIDTGSGDQLPPIGKNGKLLQSLAATGVKPKQINDILITHMHPDHIGGLVTKAGNKLFPNAELYIDRKGWMFWHNARVEKKLPKLVQSWFAIAQRETAPYKKQLHLFTDKYQQLMPGIYALPLPGHTPGHTGYLLKAKNGKSLLIWGDIVHVAMFEFPHPNWSMVFDLNRKQASKEHRKVMSWVAKNHILIGGMHLPYPGLGYVSQVGKAFKFKPAEQRSRTL